MGSFVEVFVMFNIWDRVVGILDYVFKFDIVKVIFKDFKCIKFMSSDYVAVLNVEFLKKFSFDFVVIFVGNFKVVEYVKKFGILFFFF